MHRQQGFTYLGVLLAVALLGIGLAAASEVWTVVARRQKLAQLEWVGQQYVQAIGSYYESSPGPVKEYPKSLQDLLEDRRVPVIRRHLRQLYGNPFALGGAWELVVTPRGSICGVQARAPMNGAAEDRRSIQFIYPTAH